MANVLKVAMKHAIATLLDRGRSQRSIARELGVARETVSRYVRLWRENGWGVAGRAIPTAGSEPGAARPNQGIPTAGSVCAAKGAKEAIPTTGSDSDASPPNEAIPTAGSGGRRSDCEPFRETIEAKLALGLSAQRIWQDLSEESESPPGYESVKRFVRRIEERAEAPFRRMESPPGREAQVDFGKGAFVIGEDGKRTRPHLFRMVLSHSRAGYSEVVRKQNVETFIRCIENAFLHFGGVTQTLVVDYVPGNIIDVMCPDRLCGGPASTSAGSDRFWCRSGHITDQRDLSHFRSDSSSRQTGFRGNSAPFTGGSHRRMACSFVRVPISA